MMSLSEELNARPQRKKSPAANNRGQAISQEKQATNPDC